MFHEQYAFVFQASWRLAFAYCAIYLPILPKSPAHLGSWRVTFCENFPLALQLPIENLAYQFLISHQPILLPAYRIAQKFLA